MGAHYLDVRRKPETTPTTLETVEELQVLQRAYAQFLNGCPFMPGDLVTPKPGYAMKSVGEPHIVVERRALPPSDFAGTPGSTTHGTRCDMRIAKHVGTQQYVYWVESYAFEEWIDPATVQAALEEFVGAYDCTDIDHVKRRVLEVCAGMTIGFHEILDKVDATADLVAQALEQLAGEGKILNFGGGVYGDPAGHAAP